MSHRFSRAVSDAYDHRDTSPVRYISSPGRYEPRGRRSEYTEYVYTRSPDNYGPRDADIPRTSVRDGDSLRQTGRRRTLNYSPDDLDRRYRLSGGGAHSPEISSSKTPDISDSSRTSRRQKSIHVIGDSRPPLSSRILPAQPYVAYSYDQPRRANSTSSRRSRSRDSPGTTSRLSRLFGGSSSRTVSPEKPARPERRSRSERPSRSIACVVCMEDVSLSKGADLKCGHRMCNACLRRIFRMSTTDPQHMPPRCCSQEHIPLKYVDRLFDSNFKKTWNRKFEEYSTGNRLYCPSRKCGEWIKPENIKREDGRKVARCDRCKTKVCVKCGGRNHSTSRCPKDIDTRQFLSQAAEEGWKRCYRCKAMVERREGCNHMTCRCGAEFCILCGTKWKGCDCPWFSNNGNDPDHPEAADGARGHHYPQTYTEEMRLRRLQELRDSVVARHMQNTDVEFHDHSMMGGLGDITGIGNAAGHFMNEHYVRDNGSTPNRQPLASTPAVYSSLAGRSEGYRGSSTDRRLSDRVSDSWGSRFRRSTPPAPALRPHVDASQPQTRGMAPRYRSDDESYSRPLNRAKSERVVPGRNSRRYDDEARVHAPPSRRRQMSESMAKSSAMAGLNGKGKGMNRVPEWRNFVEPGMPDGESVVGHPE